MMTALLPTSVAKCWDELSNVKTFVTGHLDGRRKLSGLISTCHHWYERKIEHTSITKCPESMPKIVAAQGLLECRVNTVMHMPL